MSAANVLRTLTPVGWLATAGVAVVVGALVLGGLGFRWDPFDLARRRLDAAEARATTATAEASAGAAEAAGQAGQIARLDAAVRTTRAVDGATDQSVQEARTADDADLPLPPARAARLRAHDDRLCDLAPDLVGCSAATDPAGTGDPAV